MGTVLAGCLVVFGTALAATLLAVFTQRMIPQSMRHEFRTYGGLVSGLVVGAFTLSVAATLALTWKQYEHAADVTNAEASALLDVYWYAHSLQNAEGDRLLEQLRTYTNTVVQQEWPYMNATHLLTPQGWRMMDQIRLGLETLEPKPGGAAERYQQVLGRIDDAAHARRTREVLAGSKLPGLLWFSLISTGVLVILVPIFFGNPRTVTRAILSCTAAAIVAFVIFIVFQINEPFSGAISVSPAAFQRALVGFMDIDNVWAHRG